MKLRSCLLLPFAIAVTTAPIVSISFPNVQPAFSASQQDKKDKPPTPIPKPCKPGPFLDTIPPDACPSPPPKKQPADEEDFPRPIRRP
jgi:hypothetical protein